MMYITKIVVEFLNNLRGACFFFQLIYNPVQELAQAYFEYDNQRYFALTGLRITLVQPGRQDPLRSFFAVADWNVQGQCLCYGHAATCLGSVRPDIHVVCEYHLVRH